MAPEGFSPSRKQAPSEIEQTPGLGARAGHEGVDRQALVTVHSLQLREQVSSPGEAPLIPKLRGQFAEFLNEGSH